MGRLRGRTSSADVRHVLLACSRYPQPPRTEEIYLQLKLQNSLMSHFVRFWLCVYPQEGGGHWLKTQYIVVTCLWFIYKLCIFDQKVTGAMPSPPRPPGHRRRAGPEGGKASIRHCAPAR